jgi:hypothetical protein
MRSFFYNRTAYVLLTVPVPECFIKLDEYFDTRFVTSSPMLHESGVLAENLCRRMADVELYASYIYEAQKSPNPFQGSILIGTLIVGYFAACKSLLDAGAITLARVYNLTLTNREMDFSKPKFLRQLDEEVGPTISGRYAPFKGLFKEIIKWRDAAVHRLTPLVITHGPGEPGKVPREKMEIKMVAQPDAEISIVVKKPKSIPWVEPLHYHKQWQSQLIAFCKEVCLDIQSQTL